MKKVAVTGAGGFVGKALCLRLRSMGIEVVGIARNDYPGLRSAGVITEQCDLAAGVERITTAIAGCDALFHVAARVGLWGRYEEFYHSNVVATKNVLSACRQAGVRRCIYTSTPSVVADGRDLKGVNEEYPYATRYLAHYPRTKAMAEREVLAAQSSDLWTIALRPHLIWGPGDTNLVPTIIDRARSGRLVRVGGGANLVDLTYIDDCVHAHILAAQALETQPQVRGKAYFISQGEPTALWGWIDQLLEVHGFPKLQRSIPMPVAYLLAYLSEAAVSILPGNREPFLTRFLICEMATDHYFDISRARKELGYAPSMSMAQAMEKAYGVQGSMKG